MEMEQNISQYFISVLYSKEEKNNYLYLHFKTNYFYLCVPSLISCIYIIWVRIILWYHYSKG